MTKSKAKTEDTELCMNAYAIEVRGKGLLMTLFKNKYAAMDHAENHFEPEGCSGWDYVRRKYNLKVVKVVVIKENWRGQGDLVE
jgi:hypothetical protein